MKSVGYLVLTNLAVILLATISFSLLGFGNYDDILSTMLFFGFVGMLGAFISLLISKRIAIWLTGMRLITNPSNDLDRWLHESVKELSDKAGIGMPDVGIYPSMEVNAFATGANRNKALVAVSQGILNTFPKEELRAVLAHEVAHIENGDMLTSTLIQGVLNTFVLLITQFVRHILVRHVIERSQTFKDLRLGLYASRFISFIVQLLLTIVATIIIMWHSRKREFVADADAAKYTSPEAMIGALEILKTGPKPTDLPVNLAAFGINESKKTSVIERLFSTHPPLDDRIAALKGQR
jgi:heat shock protein HtpX